MFPTDHFYFFENTNELIRRNSVNGKEERVAVISSIKEKETDLKIVNC